MAEVCAWCGREMDGQSRGGGRVRTNQGLICEHCTPAYFKSLSNPQSAPPPRPKPIEVEPSPPSSEAEEKSSRRFEAESDRPEPEPPSPPPEAEEPLPEDPGEGEPSPARPEKDEPPPEAEASDEEAGPDPYGLLEDIRRQVSQIRQGVVFESTSAWNVFGAVAQTFALAALIFAAVTWASGPTEMLLVSIVLQLMALTFFVNGK